MTIQSKRWPGKRHASLCKSGSVRRLAAAITPWSAALTGLLFAGGLTLALIASPPDYQQGETVRIMFVHVPAAWMSCRATSCWRRARLALVWRHPLAR